MNQSKRYQLMLVIVVAIMSLTLVACGASQESGPSQAPEAANSTPDQTSGETTEEIAATTESTSGETMEGHQMATEEFDRMFIDMMVPHHQSAIEMARIVQQQGENPELKAMAESIIQSQQAEIDQMRQWRQQWYGSSDTPPMNQMPILPGMSQMGEAGDMMMDMTPEIERVRNAPRPVDPTFIEAMMKHHQMAIEAATIAEQQATHQEIKDLAQKIIEEQQREISELERMRAELIE